jgi:hypothetical protein
VDASTGDNDGGLQSERIGDKVFELPSLVASEGEAGEVVALDPEIDP